MSELFNSENRRQWCLCLSSCLPQVLHSGRVGGKKDSGLACSKMIMKVGNSILLFATVDEEFLAELLKCATASLLCDVQNHDRFGKQCPIEFERKIG